MAQNTTYNLAADTWTLLTDADVTVVTFQNTSQSDVWIKATTDTTAPTNMQGALKYHPSMGEAARSLADLFPGLSGRDRLWAYSDEAASVFVSHA